LVLGSGFIANTGSASTSFSGLGIGANTFKWTVRNAPCPSTFDQVIITGNEIPVASAGLDQVSCSPTASLTALLAPGVSGIWTQLSGQGIIDNPNLASTTVSGLVQPLNVFLWSVSQGPCSAKDTVRIGYVSNNLNIGSDTVICQDSSLTLNAGLGFSGYTWNNGTNGQMITINQSGTYSVTVLVSGGCSFTDSIVVTVSPCTSVKPIFENQTFISLFPNPSRGKFTIDIQQLREPEANLNIYNINGVLIYKEKLNADEEKISKEIHLEKVPNGVYFIEVKSRSGVFRKKLVIQ